MKKLLRAAPPPSLLFKGRPGDPRLGEWVRCVDTPLVKDELTTPIFLLGCPDDLGVQLNHGRPGAKEGPDSIRKHLFRMTPPCDFLWEKHLSLYDLGNVLATSDILQTHQRVSEITQAIGEQGHTIILLGGGHDFAAPGFLGYAAGRKLFNSRSSFALMNVDPHLDVRELKNNKPHSGTPFRQILESKLIAGKNFVEFGSRINRNAREHFEYCKKKGVQILSLEQMRRLQKPSFPFFQQALRRISRNATVLGVTIDMDSCRDAEGTSAAPVLGFSATELVEMAREAGTNARVGYFEIAEVAPSLDSTERSSRIAAELIYGFLHSRAMSRSRKN